jgi:transposase
MGVVAGVDAHKDEHHAAVPDAQGRLLATAAFSTTTSGYARLITWLRAHGQIERIGIESTGAFAAGLVREFRRGGITVVEVNQPHPHARHRLGKSDPIDAELAARAASSGEAKASPLDCASSHLVTFATTLERLIQGAARLALSIRSSSSARLVQEYAPVHRVSRDLAVAPHSLESYPHDVADTDPAERGQVQQ